VRQGWFFYLLTVLFCVKDTEFPGVVIEEYHSQGGSKEHREYHRIKANVDILKIIQIGITISDGSGKMPKPTSTWQFNFDFDIEKDKKAQNSILLLQNSGIDFSKLRNHGINPVYFAEKFTNSGLVLNDRITWICFHGCYDFSYFLRIMMNEVLPHSRDSFDAYMKHFFPKLMDIKTFMHQFNCDGGLNRIADYLNIKRQGAVHQAGSDSLVTL